MFWEFEAGEHPADEEAWLRAQDALEPEERAKLDAWASMAVGDAS